MIQNISPQVLRNLGARPRKRPLLLLKLPVKTYIYIDGFNLYYGALIGTPYKWLDLLQMCRKLLPKNEISKIKYYTATVSARPTDPDQPVRQQTYLRAIATIPDLEIVYGQFLQSTVRMMRAKPLPTGEKFVDVIKTEEKGSDVNIATHMVHDGHRGLYDVAVIVSNDSDLLEPVKIVRHELGKPVGMICPHKHPSFTLQRHITFMRQIRQGVLRDSQFPATMRDSVGNFSKPNGW